MTYPSFVSSPNPMVPPARAGHRCRFSEEDRRRILAEADRPGANVSEVAWRYGIARRRLGGGAMTALVPAGVKVHLALGDTDLRKGMDGLALLIREVLRQDPFTGRLFVLRGRKRPT